MLVSEIIKKARLVMQDEDSVRWTDNELIGWVSEGQRQIAKFPGVYSLTKVISLVAGTKQGLPADCLQLESISHNVEADGTPTTPVRITTRSLLDSCIPFWHQVPESPVVENYVYDDKDPKHFSVFPPNDGNGRLEVTFLALPSKVTKLTDELVIDESFGAALLNWVLYRAFSKDSDFAAGSQLATTYYSSYTSEIQLEMQSRGQVSPNLTLHPGVVKQNGGTE